MDKGSRTVAGDPLIITGLGHVLGPADPTPYLKSRKSRKFMGPQDEMAVVATGLALASAGLGVGSLGERAGLFLAVGYIPFEKADLDALLDASTVDGSMSLARFSTDGIHAINPLLAFRCLPNMPAFHVSANFDVQGPYFVTYPGPGQFYMALDEAQVALRDGAVEYAIALGVAHQRNFLVEHHFRRLDPPALAGDLVDAAGCLIFETEAHAEQRGASVRGRLIEIEMSYEPRDPFEFSAPSMERFLLDGFNPGPPGNLGAASLPCFLSRTAGCERVEHVLAGRDFLFASSVWELR